MNNTNHTSIIEAEIKAAIEAAIKRDATDEEVTVATDDEFNDYLNALLTYCLALQDEALIEYMSTVAKSAKANGLNTGSVVERLADKREGIRLLISIFPSKVDIFERTKALTSTQIMIISDLKQKIKDLRQNSLQFYLAD